MSKKPTISTNLSIIIFVGMFGGLLILMGYKLCDMGYFGKAGSMPVYGEVPPFTLTEKSGASLNSLDLKGKLWVADFMFTRCAGQCPMMSLKMKGLAKQFPKATFVSFTSDPEYDTPEVLATYASWYKADPKQWLFLTGEKEEISKIAQGLKFSRLDSPDMHSNYFVLVDAKEQVRGYYDVNDKDAMNKLKTDIKKLL